MKFAWVALLLPAFWGCSNDEKLTGLETKQRELRTQFDQTSQQVADMRKQLQEYGVLDREAAMGRESKVGKKRAPTGHVTPTNDLTESFKFTAARTGTPTPLPPLPPVERTDTNCGWKFKIESLQPISDFPLNALGYGKAGPLVLTANGEAYAPHAMPPEYEASCAGGFRHAGYLILFAPKGSADVAQNATYAISLDPRFPMPRGDDDRPMYWIYPGTTATLTSEKGWDAAWGALDVDLALRQLGAHEGAVTIKVNGTELPPGDKELSVVRSTLDPLPTGPITIEISSPANGPYALVDTLTVGNAENAAVVSAEQWWRKHHKGAE